MKGLSLAIVLELRGKNCLRVLRVSGEDEALTCKSQFDGRRSSRRSMREKTCPKLQVSVLTRTTMTVVSNANPYRPLLKKHVLHQHTGHHGIHTQRKLSSDLRGPAPKTTNLHVFVDHGYRKIDHQGREDQPDQERPIRQIINHLNISRRGVDDGIDVGGMQEFSSSQLKPITDRDAKNLDGIHELDE